MKAYGKRNDLVGRKYCLERRERLIGSENCVGRGKSGGEREQVGGGIIDEAMRGENIGYV